MKKLIQALIVFALLVWIVPAQGEVRTFFLYLGTTDSGNTTTTSGVSNLIVAGGRYKRSDMSNIIHNVDLHFDGYFTVQLVEITVSQSQQGVGGSLDNVPFTLRFRKSDIDNAAAWAGASNYDVPEFSGIVLSGTTRRSVTVEIPNAEFVMWDFVTGGTTLFDHAKFKFKAR